MADNKKIKEVMDAFNVTEVYVDEKGEIFLTEKANTQRVCRHELTEKKNQKVKEHGE